MEWKTVKLGDCLSKIIDNRGKTPKDLAASGHPLLEINAVSKDNKYPLYGEAKKYVDDVVYSTWFRSGHPQYGDILVPTVGTLGAVAYVDRNDCCIAQNLIALRANADICDSAYIYYLLCNPQIVKRLLNLDIGAVQASIKVPHLLALEIPLPPLETQRRIAAILSSLDDKIENNNRINRNLEAQAQALFKSWFVDFEPWGGVMPRDWMFDNISAFPHILETGRRPKGGAVESGVPSIGAEHIKGMGTYDYSKTKYITEEYARSMKAGKIKGYELLIYKDGGKPGYFIPNFTIYGEGYPFDECYINEHVLKLDFPDKAFNIFCYFYFQEPEVMTYLNAQGGKAAIPGINKSDIENINILSPENEAVKQFGDIVMPYFTTILRNLKENHRLAALRDTLLPKLMKGEIAL